MEGVQVVGNSTSNGPVSVCLSVTSRCSVEVVGRIELVFGTMCVNSKNEGTSLWNFFLNSGLRKFHHGISIERAINL